MSFSSGVFQRIYNWVNDKNAAINITASRMDSEMDGMATGLSTCMLKDGTQTITANIPMAGFKFTGLGSGAARTDSASIGQLQDKTIGWVAAGGTVDAITATYSPAITVLVDGMTLGVRASGANATTTPTFAPNGLAAHTIVRGGGTALNAGDIPAANAEILLRYNLASTRWELLNPYPSFKVLSFTYNIATATGTQAVTGVGFKPKAVVFLSSVVATAFVNSIGIDDGVTGGVFYDNGNVVANTWGTSAASLVLQTAGSNFASGVIQSFDADGCTIAWTKTGTPTGTVTVKALFFR